MDNKLPTYKISISPELAEDGEKLGMTQVAYTATPAILTRGVAFSGTMNKQMVYTDVLKYQLAAPALIPDQLIYREDNDLGEYNVVFDAQTIEEIRADFMLNKGKVAFNLDHNTTLEAPSYILDSWITGDPETDPSFTKYGIKVPAGSWFVVSQFTDKEFFIKEIIEKDRVGYSIEGMLALKFETIKQQIKQNKMEKQTFETKVGDVSPLADGEYKMKNGDLLIVKDEVIVEIKKADAPVAEPAVEEAAVETPVAETLAEPVVEEVPVTEPVVEEAPVAEPVKDGVIDEAAILAIVQPKFDELYKLIADLKTLVEAADVPVEGAEDVIMKGSSFQALAAYIKALKN